jgi:hypothetical protein
MLPRVAKSMGLVKKKPPTNEQLTQTLKETQEVLKLVKALIGCPPTDKHSFDSLWEDSWKAVNKLINKINSILEG